jgi:thioredoxin reductase (NADPH)
LGDEDAAEHFAGAEGRVKVMAMTPAEQDEQFYRDTESIAFPKLSDEQLALLEPLGKRRRLRRGDFVLKAGQREFPLTITLEGELEVFETRDGVEQVLATSRARDFLGDVSMLQGTSALASARVKSAEAEVLQIPARQLRRALAEMPQIGEPIVNALIMRRRRLKRDRDFAGLRVLAVSDSREGRQLDDFLDKNHIPHRLVDVRSDQGVALARRLHLDDRDLPTLITPRGAPLRRPSLREVAREAGLLRPLADENEDEIKCDLAIVGAGPAGLAAAVYATSEGLNTVVLEGYAPGGQAGSSSLIENFFGFPTGISGGDLTWRAQLQAYRFGAKFSTPSQALSLTYNAESEYRVSLQIEGCSATLCAKCAVIATGANYRRLEAEGRERFEGVGVYYAATAFESRLCRGATVIIVGGGNSAGQAAMFLSQAAAKVLLVIRGNDLNMSDYLSRRVLARENIELLSSTTIRRMTGNAVLEAVELENAKTGERRTVETPAVFSMIGATPCTEWLPPEIMCDTKGFIKTGALVAEAPIWAKIARPPAALETSLPGIFAAGDVRSGSVKRCAAAVGEGSMAIAGVHEALREAPTSVGERRAESSN